MNNRSDEYTEQPTKSNRDKSWNMYNEFIIKTSMYNDE